MITYFASEEWQGLLTRVIDCAEIDPIHTAGGNGRKSREIISHQTIVSMEYPVVTNLGRSLNYRFMCAEAHMLLSGSNKVADIEPYCKVIKNYSDDGVTFFGAYGPRIHSQMPSVLCKLMGDPNSRQAVLTIWRENPPASKDIPCTLSLQFLVRKNRLHTIANMRSSDVWLGWPYDVFNFSMVSASVVLALRKYPGFSDLQLGQLYLTAGSQHLYETHYDTAKEVIARNRWAEYPRFNLDEYDEPLDLMVHLKAMADGKYTLKSFLKTLIV